MTPAAFLSDILRPGLAHLHSLGGPAPSADAERFLLAVALQESGLVHRYQVLDGGRKRPARGYWQFEAGGGVKGVLHHPASRDLARKLCISRGVNCACQDAAWAALEHDAILAAGFARLLLWTDKQTIPTTSAGAWVCYAARLWLPGKPHPKAWPANWRSACEAVDQA